jgi:DNA repair exonuclease SbcCD ATPase subunit
MKKPFIKVTWDDSPENFTPEKIKRVKSYFEKKYKTKSVRVITNSLIDINNTELKSLDFTENIVDHQYQKKLMDDFITENGMEVNRVLLDKLDDRVNEKVLELNVNKVKHNKWFIREIEFDNFLSFGQNNKLVFDQMDGITVVESIPKNFGGKSTATVDLLLFLFFGRTTKTKTNIEIFNRFTEENEVSVKGKLTIDGEDYIIHRTIVRKRSRKNDYNVTNSLDFFKITDNGIENLEGERRQDTEKFIESAIGTEEDFLSTILTTGYNLEELIESKPTARGQILTKFLGLENLKQKEEICKDIYNDWNKKLVSNSFNIVTLETEIENFNEQINVTKITIEDTELFLKTRTKQLSEFENEKDGLLSKRNNDIDVELLATNPTQLKSEIEELNKKLESKKILYDDVTVIEPSKYYNEDDHEKIIAESHNIILDGKTIKNEVDVKQNFIKQLKEGSICPTCKQPLKDVDHTNEILNSENEIIELENKRKTLLEKLFILQNSSCSI